MSGHQLPLSEPEQGGLGPMSTEQVKCSCGNVSSKAAPSITLNKRGSAATSGRIGHAAEGRLFNTRHLFVFLPPALFASLFLLIHSFSTVTHAGRSFVFLLHRRWAWHVRTLAAVPEVGDPFPPPSFLSPSLRHLLPLRPPTPSLPPVIQPGKHSAKPKLSYRNQSFFYRPKFQHFLFQQSLKKKIFRSYFLVVNVKIYLNSHIKTESISF